MDNHIANCPAFVPPLANWRWLNTVGLSLEPTDHVDIEPADHKCEFSATKSTCSLSGLACNDGLVWTVRLTICLE